MPWDITIVNYAGNPPVSYYDPGRPEPEPLGSRDEVIRAIREAVSELEWHERSTPVALLPPDFLAILSPETREAMSRPKLEALYDTDDLYIKLYGFEQEPMKYVCGEVRGKGDPVQLLARVCVGRRWSVVSDTDGSFVDLTAAAAPQGCPGLPPWAKDGRPSGAEAPSGGSEPRRGGRA